MGNLSILEKRYKLKALRVALILLERNGEKINPTIVLNKANKIGCPKYFKTSIARGSVHAPKTQEFRDIVDIIDQKKKEYKKRYKREKNNTTKIIGNLKSKVENLTFTVAELLEENRNNIILLQEKENSLDLLRKERKILLNRIEELKKNENKLC